MKKLISIILVLDSCLFSILASSLTRLSLRWLYLHWHSIKCTTNLSDAQPLNFAGLSLAKLLTNQRFVHSLSRSHGASPWQTRCGSGTHGSGRTHGNQAVLAVRVDCGTLQHKSLHLGMRLSLEQSLTILTTTLPPRLRRPNTGVFPAARTPSSLKNFHKDFRMGAMI